LPQKYLSTTDVKLIIRNVSLATNRHDRMISEGSCDAEYWMNDAENSALLSQEIILNIFNKKSF